LDLGEKNWSEDTFKKWERITPVIEKLLALDNLITTAKAFELSFDFEHILSSIKILTDVRPVYSPDRDKIIGGIICNKLRIHYEDEDRVKSLSIAIDQDEIQKLQKICDDALTKIEQASSLLSEAKLPSFISGEEYDVFD
jgi:hypothetical protein